MEIMLYLPEKYKERIKKVCKEIVKTHSKERTWKAYECLYFLDNYNLYDLKKINYDNIHCDLRSIKFKLTKYNNGKKFKVLRQLQLKNDLALVKSGIDQFIEGDKNKEEYYMKVTNILDQFADFRRRLKRQVSMPYITNAFLKCWEMIQDFKLIPYDHMDNYRVFCNAEFPGAFIFAIHHYMSTSTISPLFEWYGNSLWPGSDNTGNILGDEFGLYKKYRQNWLMDSTDHIGDVTDIKTIDHIYDKIGESVDLYTSDIGIGLNIENFNDQEEVETSLNLGQIICGLVSLKKGGHLVCKMFMFFTPFNISLLYVLNDMFSEFYISKPVTSRPGNSEIYIIGKGYKGYDVTKEKINKLKEFLVLFSSSGHNINKLREISDMMVDEITEEFYQRIVNASYGIYQRQMRYVDMSVKIAQYLYRHHIPPTFTYTTVDRNIIPGTNVELAQEIKHRQQIVHEWKKRYNEYLLHKKIYNPL
jgi:hypothetical protein